MTWLWKAEMTTKKPQSSLSRTTLTLIKVNALKVVPPRLKEQELSKFSPMVLSWKRVTIYRSSRMTTESKASKSRKTSGRSPKMFPMKPSVSILRKRYHVDSTPTLMTLTDKSGEHPC